MEHSRRWLPIAVLVVSVSALAIVMTAVYCPRVAAQDQPPRWFVVCKYEDLDRDGRWTSFQSDPSLNGWTFTLYGPPGPPEQKTTSGDGCAVFDKPVESFQPYTICEQLQTGWVNSDPGGGQLCKSYSVGPDYIGPIEVLFGNYQLPIGGKTEPASNLALLTPWFTLGVLVLVAGVAVTARVRRAE